MKTVTLGQSQLTASRIAYGCWRIATKGDAAADYAAAKAAIFAAVGLTVAFAVAGAVI